MDLKSFDMSMLKKLMDPKLAGDINAFLEKLPDKAGHSILIAAGIAWVAAAAAGLFTTIKVQQLTELRNTVIEAQTLVPIVPKISDNPVSADQVKEFAEKAAKIYPDLQIQANGSSILVTSSNTAHYGQFREAIGYIQNGGSGWRVNLEKMCVGRECDKQYQLAISVNINKVSVDSTASGG